MASPQGAAVVLLLLLPGCVEAVSLGSQCGLDDCKVTPSSGQAEPGAPLVIVDATVTTPVDMGSRLDGGLTEGDAGSGTPPKSGSAESTLSDLLQNDSFEVRRGSFGPLAYSPIDPVPVGLNTADPWSACGFGVSVLEAADAMRGSGMDDVLPTDGPGFAEANLGVPAFQGIRQTLEAPLRANKRYSFMIDVRAARGADVTLEVWGSYVDCVGSMKLTELGKVDDSAWQSVCVSFMPPQDVPQLFLQPALRSSQSNGDLRVFFDNIRADPRCL